MRSSLRRGIVSALHRNEDVLAHGAMWVTQWPSKSYDGRIGCMLDDVTKQLKIPSAIGSAETHLDQNITATSHRFPRTLEHLSLKSLNVDLQEIRSVIGVQNSI